MQSVIRRLAWRLGRRLYCWARGDGSNDPSTNGEYWLLANVIRSAAAEITLVDVGANLGAWSANAVALGAASSRQVRVWACEPCASTCLLLRERVKPADNIEVCRTALSSFEGSADFFSDGQSSGTNSLHSISGRTLERVTVTTLDTFLDERGLGSISMVKIDTEGFDLNVLMGATRTLRAGRIDVVQFEYNWRWIVNKASLREVFTLIEGTPYRLGKVLGQSIAFFDEWHFELDRYFENNYVLIRKGTPIEQLGYRNVFDASNCAVRAVDFSAQ